MLVFFLATIAASVSAQTVYDYTYSFGQLSSPINNVAVFDCGANPNRAFKNWKFVFDRNDLELPGSFTIIDFEVDVTKQVVGPQYGKIEAWRAFSPLGITFSLQIGCLPLPGSQYGVGTCDYGDVCQILATGRPIDALTGAETCYEDSVLLGIPQDKCGCDGIAPGHYTIKGWNKLVDLTGLEPGILTFLASGDYEIRVTATDDAGLEQACIGVRVPVREYVDPNADSGWLFGRKKRSTKL